MCFAHQLIVQFGGFSHVILLKRAKKEEEDDERITDNNPFVISRTQLNSRLNSQIGRMHAI